MPIGINNSAIRIAMCEPPTGTKAWIDHISIYYYPENCDIYTDSLLDKYIIIGSIKKNENLEWLGYGSYDYGKYALTYNQMLNLDLTDFDLSSSFRIPELPFEGKSYPKDTYIADNAQWVLEWIAEKIKLHRLAINSINNV